MNICAACHTYLPKDNYSKKQWKLDKCQRRCKVCITNNRGVQAQPPQQNNNDTTDNGGLVKVLDSMCIEDVEISDEDLFKQPPPLEDCPICFIRLPSLQITGRKYYSCCGKVVCSGCIYAPVYDDQGNTVDNQKCPFCRIPTPYSDEGIVERLKSRVEAGDPYAIYNIGLLYQEGKHGFNQDHKKALELWHRAGELGLTDAYYCIGSVYSNGEGVEVDMKKANHYYEQAAIRGNETARYNLAILEEQKGNYDRALKHFMISVRGGDSDSLDAIKALCLKGNATKEDYTKALQLYQAYLGEIMSAQRDEAAEFSKELYRYY